MNYNYGPPPGSNTPPINYGYYASPYAHPQHIPYPPHTLQPLPDGSHFGHPHPIPVYAYPQAMPYPPPPMAMHHHPQYPAYPPQVPPPRFHPAQRPPPGAYGQPHSRPSSFYQPDPHSLPPSHHQSPNLINHPPPLRGLPHQTHLQDAAQAPSTPVASVLGVIPIAGSISAPPFHPQSSLNAEGTPRVPEPRVEPTLTPKLPTPRQNIIVPPPQYQVIPTPPASEPSSPVVSRPAAITPPVSPPPVTVISSSSSVIAVPSTPASPTTSIASTLSRPPKEDPIYHLVLKRPRASDNLALTISLHAKPPQDIVANARSLPSEAIQTQTRPSRTKPKSKHSHPAPVPSSPSGFLSFAPHVQHPLGTPLPQLPPSVRIQSGRVVSFSSSAEQSVVSEPQNDPQAVVPSEAPSIAESTPATSIGHTRTPGSPLSSSTSVSGAAVPIEEVDVKTPELPVEAPKEEDAPTPKPAPRPNAWGSNRSFASLLRAQNPTSDETSTASVSKGLATSMQTGFSVPSVASLEVDYTSIFTPRQHSNLIQLLSTGTVPPSHSSQPSTSSATGPAAPQIAPRGLVNMGNMCFANSILQVLLYTPAFWRLFSELGKVIGGGPVVGSGNKKDDGKGTPLTDAMIAFLNEFKPPATPLEPKSQGPKRDSFVASNFYAALKTKSRFDAMRKGHQEDAEEFLGFLLDTLHEEVLGLLTQFGGKGPTPGVEDEEDVEGDEEESVSDEWREVGKKNRPMVTRTTKATESAITAIFGGKFRSILRASGRSDSASVEQWRCLPLDIQPAHINTIEDALYNISTPETVQLQAGGGKTVDATKQMFIEGLPPVLVLHVKRFVYDATTGIGKIGKKITFGPELDIRTDLLSPALRKGPGAKYKLYGVIYHHGLSATGGHYTLDVLHPNPNLTASLPGPSTPVATPLQKPPTPTTEGWVRFDDESVRRLRPDDVFGNSSGGGPWKVYGDDRVAYLLFYRRVPTRS